MKLHFERVLRGSRDFKYPLQMKLVNKDRGPLLANGWKLMQ